MKRHFERRHRSAHVQLTRRIVCAFATIVVALATIIGASGCSSSQNASSTYTLVEHGKLTVASDLAPRPRLNTSTIPAKTRALPMNSWA